MEWAVGIEPRNHQNQRREKGDKMGTSCIDLEWVINWYVSEMRLKTGVFGAPESTRIRRLLS